jgi:hypothetical protein
MKDRLSYIVIPGVGITAVIDGKPYTLTSDNPSYHEVEDAIRDGEEPEAIADMFNAANAVKRYSHGAISVDESGAALFYKGEQIHNVVVDRILAFMREGLPVQPLINFLERLLANPSRRSVQELYSFLENERLPITEDGHFIGYRAVRSDWKDKFSGSVDNSIGQKPWMKRNDVDDDARRACSNGFHVGSFDYASGYASSGDRMILVKVDPADVVSVPFEDAGKLRTQSYEVIAEYKKPLSNTYHRCCELPADEEAYI